MVFLLNLTAFLSAFLLFGMQPMIARAILPWFGGAAGVWNCAQFFFQGVLLLGYGYAHLSITGAFRPGREGGDNLRAASLQGKFHLILIGLSLFFLPVLPSPRWKPTAADDPALWVMLTLLFTVGVPYLVLSSTSPLVASWHARFLPKRSPYILFAWSNLGSLLGLLAYPVIFEPTLGVRSQAWLWSSAYVLCAALLAYLAHRQRTVPFLSEEGEEREKSAAPAPRADTILLWLGLPACSSVLLVAVTHYITTEVAAVPLLWVIPLALYLVSYIFVASSWNLYRRVFFVPLFPVALYGLQRMLDPEGWAPLDIVVCLWICLLLLFLLLHGELWQQKPATRFLSHFYLTMSAGGAIGSFLVAYVFPKIFDANYELYLTIFICPLLVLWSLVRERAQNWKPVHSIANLAIVLFFVYSLGTQLLQVAWKYNGGKIAGMRNFYGAAWVAQVNAGTATRTLFNGRINHGFQFLQPDRQMTTTGYFSRVSGVGRLFGWLESEQPSLKVGIVGLGIGTLAGYGRAGDDVTFYELDPKIETLAERYFTFLPRCAAAHRVVLGDARLSLENEPGQLFDFLIIDAFTGDSIPVHLLTAEAFQTYVRVLKPNGVIALHVSNLYLDLPPVVQAQAQKLGRTSLQFTNEGGNAELDFPSQWSVILPPDRPGARASVEKLGFRPVPPALNNPWTDDESNLLTVIRSQTLPGWLRFGR